MSQYGTGHDANDERYGAGLGDRLYEANCGMSQQSGGAVSVRSEKGSGTTVTIYLRRALTQAASKVDARLPIAPASVAMASPAPKTTVRGVNSSAEAISSMIPLPMRPHGSAPSVLKIYTDSGAPLNLKNRVCSRMTAGIPAEA